MNKNKDGLCIVAKRIGDFRIDIYEYSENEKHQFYMNIPNFNFSKDLESSEKTKAVEEASIITLSRLEHYRDMILGELKQK